MTSARLISRSPFTRWILPAALLCTASTALAQTVPAQQIAGAAQAPVTQPLAIPSRNLTQPQSQPDLSVDADPIHTPDLPKPAEAATVPGATTPGVLGTKQNNGFVFRTEVEEVLLPVTVVNERGQLVKDLTRQDFKVWEDNAPQAVTSFTQRDVPISLGILVDNSGSMRDKHRAVEDAAIHLVQLSNPDDSAFVVNFSSRAILDQGFTSNIALLRQGLDHFDSRGETALYDAVAASADEMSHEAKEQKQVLLIITDGADNASHLSLEQAIHRVQALDGPTVYAIGLLYDAMNSDEAARTRHDLQELALQTGGVAYFPGSLDQVDIIAAQVADDIRNQYTLGYHSTKPFSQGGYRAVRVEATGPGMGPLTVRTRKGYYPHGQNGAQDITTTTTTTSTQAAGPTK